MEHDYTYKDFDALCACQTLRKSARALTRRYNAALKAVELNIGQFTTLASLLRSDPVQISVLAEQLGMDRTTLTRDLKPLERRGLVVSRGDDEDARQRRLIISDTGRELMKHAIPLWENAQQETKKEMSDNVWTNLRNDLQNLTV
ncbi:MAG: MarR family winged helix-turn-helix transcriptional regulator [Pseudomonadota bacterium]